MMRELNSQEINEIAGGNIFHDIGDWFIGVGNWIDSWWPF
jgi:hypothetical protein